MMLDVILAILAAISVIVVSGFLVSWQNKQEMLSMKLRNEVTDNLSEAVIDYNSLTGKAPTEETIFGLTKDIQKLNRNLNRPIIRDKYSDKRRNNRYVKR